MLTYDSFNNNDKEMDTLFIALLVSGTARQGAVSEQYSDRRHSHLLRAMVLRKGCQRVALLPLREAWRSSLPLRLSAPLSLGARPLHAALGAPGSPVH